MKQFTLRGDFDIGKLTAVFEIPSSRWMELVRALGWSNRPTEFSCFSDGVHPGWSSLAAGRLRPRTVDATKSFYVEQLHRINNLCWRVSRGLSSGAHLRDRWLAITAIGVCRKHYRVTPSAPPACAGSPGSAVSRRGPVDPQTAGA